MQSIQDLPGIMYEVDYRPNEWDRPGWVVASRSFLFRFLITLYPLRDEERVEVSSAAKLSVNRALLRSFAEAVRKNGAQPFLVYLPSDADFPARPYATTGIQLLQASDIESKNLVPCLSEVREDDRLLPSSKGGHYTPIAHAELAKCLQPTVLEMLRARLGHAGSASHAN